MEQVKDKNGNSYALRDVPAFTCNGCCFSEPDGIRCDRPYELDNLALNGEKLCAWNFVFIKEHP